MLPPPTFRNHASHASNDITRSGRQIFSPCRPLTEISVNPKRPGRFFAPYQRAAVGPSQHDADANSSSEWHIVDRRRAMKFKGKVPGSSPRSCPIGIPSRITVPCSNRFQDLSVSEFNPHDEFAATPGPAETIHAEPDSCSRPPHGGSTTQSCISPHDSRNHASAS